MSFTERGYEVSKVSGSYLSNLANHLLQNFSEPYANVITRPGIKVARRNINNLRYEDDTTLTAESKEELKSILVKVKEESEKAGLKLNIQKTQIMASGLITSWQINGGKWKSDRLLLSWAPKTTVDGDCSHEIKRYLLLERKAMMKPRQYI